MAQATGRADLLNWVALNSVKGVGAVTFRRLVERFGGPAAVLGAGLDELLVVDGVGRATAEAIRDFADYGRAEEELKKAVRGGVDIVTFSDERYPAPLREIHDPPPYLYVKGDLAAQDMASIAIVGSRTATTYGRQVTARMARDLAFRGVTVVSGGARGIDTEAHKAALDAGGRTVCVLGCGMDVAYPPENRGLFSRAVNSGAVVTEFPFGTPPEGQNFPKRNRIISGLSLGVIVVEAAGDSGSLITASCALDQGREVYAVPGSVASPMSRGTNDLIKRGAKLVEDASDVLADLFPHLKGCLDRLKGGEDCEGGESGVGGEGGEVDGGCRPGEPGAWSGPELGEDEKALYDRIGLDPLHVDELASISGIPASRALSVLLGLELKGAVRQLAGMRFVRYL